MRFYKEVVHKLKFPNNSNDFFYNVHDKNRAGSWLKNIDKTLLLLYIITMEGNI